MIVASERPALRTEADDIIIDSGRRGRGEASQTKRTRGCKSHTESVRGRSVRCSSTQLMTRSSEIGGRRLKVLKSEF